MWDGTRWVDDVTGEIHRTAILTVRAIPKEAEGVTDRDAWAAIMRHALASENAARLAAMVKIAQSLAAFAVRVDDFDRDPWLLNTPSGTVHLRTGELRPHDRGDLITRITAAPYVPGATSEEWDRFLVAVTEGIDVAMREREPPAEERLVAARVRAFLQRIGGMSATGDASEEVAPLLHGPTNSGKSTLVSAVTKALGDYAVTTDFDTFLKRKQPGGIRTDLIRLNRAHMVASVEVEDGRELAAALFKRITGGDEQTARGLYASEIVIQPTATFWLVANHAPRIDADDGAMWRRILHVPFPHTVPPERRDAGVKRHLTDPEGGGPAVLAWLVEGALAWQRDGLQVPESITAATADLRRDMDATSGFFEDRCELDPMATALVSTLHMSYLDWARQLGIREPLDRKRFGEHVTTRLGCTRTRGTGSQHIWRGVRLLPAHDPDSVASRPVNPFAPPAQEAAMPQA